MNGETSKAGHWILDVPQAVGSDMLSTDAPLQPGLGFAFRG